MASIRMTVIAVAAVAILAGCGSDGDEAAPTTTAPTTTAPTTTESTEAPATESTVPPTTESAALVYEPTDVLMALSSAGLDVPDRRDNTDGQCAEMPCSEWITSDLLTIVVWNTAEDATSWGEGKEGKVLLVGDKMTVTFAEGGSTPEYDRAAYTTVIEGI